MKINNIKQASLELQSYLETHKGSIAVMIGVSEKTLEEWENDNEISNKSKRLLRLNDVVSFMKEKYFPLNPEKCKDFLYNARFVFDENDEEGSVSLLGFISAYPNKKNWKKIVALSIKEYKKFLNERSFYEK